MTKPRFNNAFGPVGWTLQSNVPARFKGVTARVFPLKARMDVLRAFCDAYVNIAPGVVHFEPAFPYVYLMVLNYGQMSAEVENMGWVSQHEVAFAIPLLWYRLENSRPVFCDSATVCPFIFVDNELSLSTGREVYGWPKVKAWLHPEVSPWLDDPRHGTRLLSLSTMLYTKLFAGRRQEPEVLVEVKQRPLPSFSQFPPDLSNPLGPLLRFSTAVVNGLSLLGQLIETMTRLPVSGYAGSQAVPSFSALSSLARRGAAWNPYVPQRPTNQITLKQFRDAELPAHICYQAIVNSQIQLTRFNGGGAIGDLHLLAGDLSGGCEILLHRYEAQPIIESLGIDVAREMTVDYRRVSVLEPVLPFWLDIDLEYGPGRTLCWRTRHSAWHTDAAPSASAPATASQNERPHRFNTALGAALQDVIGPFDFPNTTLRVLPLMADGKCLQKICNSYVNEMKPDIPNDFYRFEPWGSYVYLIAISFEEMSSMRDDIGRWTQREIGIFMPVKWYDVDHHLLSVALVPVFNFADSGTAAITAREVSGVPTLTAAIRSPSNTWMNESGPSEGTDKGLLTLETTVFPAVHLGQRAQWKRVLEIHANDALPCNDDVHWRVVADTWGRELVNDHEQKVAASRSGQFKAARALAVEILANRSPINTITLKQFRDVSDPLCACYQSLVCLSRLIDVVYDVREIEEPIHVSIHRYPTLNIVDTLGLKTKWTATTGSVAVDILQPIRPFWLRLALKDDFGQNLCWRADTQWRQEKKPAPFYFESRDASATDGDLTSVGVGLVDKIDEDPSHAQRLGATFSDWKPGKGERLKRSAAAAAVEAIEPQAIIESTLSHEWLNWGSHRGSRNLERKPEFYIPAHSIGEPTVRKNFFHRQEGLVAGPQGEWYSKLLPAGAGAKKRRKHKGPRVR